MRVSEVTERRGAGRGGAGVPVDRHAHVLVGVEARLALRRDHHLVLLVALDGHHLLKGWRGDAASVLHLGSQGEKSGERAGGNRTLPSNRLTRSGGRGTSPCTAAEGHHFLC